MAWGTRLTIRIETRIWQYTDWRQEATRSCATSSSRTSRAAMAFVNRVAELAEERNHHPDILVHGWNNVRLTLSTHSEGGVTENDHALAERRSTRWLDARGSGAAGYRCPRRLDERRPPPEVARERRRVTALLLLAVVLLVFANGFFVAAEFALVRSRRSQLEELADEGNARRAPGARSSDDLNQYLCACQFGITLASLGIGFLGEPAIAELFEPAARLRRRRTRRRSIAIAYLIIDVAAHHDRRAGARRSTRSSSAEAVALRIARPLIMVQHARSGRSSRCSTAPRTAILRGLRHQPERRARGGRDASRSCG